MDPLQPYLLDLMHPSLWPKRITYMVISFPDMFPATSKESVENVPLGGICIGTGASH